MGVKQSNLSEIKEVASQVPVIEATNIMKAYGPTQAVDDMNLTIKQGEVVGLVGANGAGKSTLMKILSGLAEPDCGSLMFNGAEINLKTYSTSIAQAFGIRVVYQELSLCTNLKVYENFYIEQYKRLIGRRWHIRAKELAQMALDEVFPDHNIDPATIVDDLTIAQRQMVEIARATIDPNLKLLILDEPTSSLGAEQTNQLQNYIVKSKKNRGLSFIFISHRLKEILTLSDIVVVMQNGRLNWNGFASTVNEADLVQKMGGSVTGALEYNGQADKIQKNIVGDIKVDINYLNTQQLHDINIKFHAGEIIGIAGLEGSGQKALLHELYQAGRKKSSNIHLFGRMAFVSGDRTKEGVFQHWSIKKNASITNLMRPDIAKIIDNQKEAQKAQEWFERLKIKAPSIEANLVSLSGGNQQKVIIARALLSEADIILLDDPTRGVDVETKKQLYSLFREVANEGKVVIWYSTEDKELTVCDRVYVMRSGHIVKELCDNISIDQIIEASFINVQDHRKISIQVEEVSKASKYFNLVRSQRTSMSLVVMILIFIVMGLVHPSAVSLFGLTLLIGTSIPLILSSMSQMFIIAGGDIDLGVGAYIGLINVISATILVNNPFLGVLCMVLGIIAYGLLATIIQLRKIPAIVVTLGSSFIWFGVALSILDRPGGSSPQWLMDFFNFNTPFIPAPIILAFFIGFSAYLILMRSRYGTVLRGFGNNSQSVVRSGWSALWARISLFVLAGFYGTLAGLSLTGITTAADANATSSYTLLTVAAVVMGGGNLVGGIVEPFGVVFGAITLAMIGALLGFLNVPSTYQSAVQGGILFLILAIRLTMRRRTI